MSETVAAGPRPVKAMLKETLLELRAREVRLARLAGELSDTRAAIRALAKLVGEDEPEPRPAPVTITTAPQTNVQRAQMPRVDRQQAVRDAIGKHQPAASGLLCRETGLSLTQLKDTLAQLIDDRQVQKVGKLAGTRYWLTADLDRYAAEHGGAIPGEGL